MSLHETQSVAGNSWLANCVHLDFVTSVKLHIFPHRLEGVGGLLYSVTWHLGYSACSILSLNCSKKSTSDFIDNSEFQLQVL